MTTSTAILIADLGYGDAGKGSIIDTLARVTGAHTVVRYNGGAQAAHNVVTPDGRHHTFAQFGSATFLPGVRTHLSRHMILHPIAMLSEERHLRSLGVTDAFARASVDPEALVITPFQQAANRLRELARGDARHGSCGLGIGETQADALALGPGALRAGDLGRRARMRRKLQDIRDHKIAQLEAVLALVANDPAAEKERAVLFDPDMVEITADLFAHFARQVEWVDAAGFRAIANRPGTVLFEGAQGVLLDEWWGFYPYNSWSTLTFQNADEMLSEAAFSGTICKLGLTRGYATRHGAGPFVTEDTYLTARLQDPHNRQNPWQQAFRAGYLDLVALRYSLAVTGRVDGLCVTNLDRMEAIPSWRICESYQYPGDPNELDGFFDHSEGRVTAIRVPPDPTDLVRQERLTHFLKKMKPVYTLVDSKRAPYLEQVCRLLDAPLALTSWGPTAFEKSLHSAAFLPQAAGEMPWQMPVGLGSLTG